MKRLSYFCFLLLFSLGLSAQTTVSGLVWDAHNEPIIGASLLLVGTYDGTVTDTAGRFQFETTQVGEVVLKVSYLGYESRSIQAPVTELTDLHIRLRESVTSLDAVVVTASTFTAGDNSKVAALKPLDIVTTAGSVGDVVGALQTLPGTQANPEDGRLFVRGGEARETQIYIDGLRVFSPFNRTIGGSPTRGRFSPFLFKGISFSTGGYSAGFGQALSGVLDMSTIDAPAATQTNLNLMSLGVGVGHTQVWDKHSLSLNANYINLSPYAALVPGRIDWLDAYAGFSGEAVYRYPTAKGLFKSYIAADDSGFELARPNIDTQMPDTLAIRNRNLYSNSSYRGFISEQTSLLAGLSIGHNHDRLDRQPDQELRHALNGWHARVALKTVFTDRLILDYGLDHLQQSDRQSALDGEQVSERHLGRGHSGAFAEVNYFFSKNLALRAGLRAEYHYLLQRATVAPRLTIARKLSDNGQISAAYGRFYQEVISDWLLIEPRLAPEQATHYLLNYNLKTDQQMLRIETYYKAYDALLKYESERAQPNNDGSGYAYGLDLFWRSNAIIRNVDCWVSYSWIAHERNYLDFPTAAMPAFSTTHNLSVVSKIWFPKLQSQLGITLNYASGRPYENPNTPGFLNERAKPFRAINLSWAYLLDPQKILFVSVSNATGFRNEFGYEYASTPDLRGVYPGQVVRPNDDSFFFVGFFVTLSADKTKNQLDNL